MSFSLIVYRLAHPPPPPTTIQLISVEPLCAARQTALTHAVISMETGSDLGAGESLLGSPLRDHVDPCGAEL